MIGLVATFLLLALVSMTLAAVEGAFYFCKRRRLGHLAVQNPRAELVNRYLADPLLLLMPVHIGTYTAHVGMTVCVTALFIDFAHWSLLAAFSVMIVYLLAFRLTLPYALVRRSPERALLLLLPAFDAYARALRPLVGVLRRRASPESLLAESGTAPQVPELPPAPVHVADEDRIVDAVQRFTATQVRDIMTPRPDIVSVAAAGTVADARRVVRESKYSRVPVTGEDLDDIVGVVTVRDLVAWEDEPAASLSAVVRPAHMVPDGKKIAELLKEFQASRTTFAVVIDEYGGTAGIVTIEDIVEELVGEIEDEFDQDVDPIAVEADGAVVVVGRVHLERLEQTLELPWARAEELGASTVGGLVTAVFGRIPQPGDKVDFEGYSLEVVDAGHKRVNRVRFRRRPVETSA